MKWQIWTSFWKHHEPDSSPYNFFVMGMRQGGRTNVNMPLTLQGEYDKLEEAQQFAFLLLKSGKWNTVHIREVKE